MQNWKFCHKQCLCVHLWQTAESLLRIFFALNTFLVASLSFREISQQAELQILKIFFTSHGQCLCVFLFNFCRMTHEKMFLWKIYADKKIEHSRSWKRSLGSVWQTPLTFFKWIALSGQINAAIL